MVSMQVCQYKGPRFKSRFGQIAYFQGVKTGLSFTVDCLTNECILLRALVGKCSLSSKAQGFMKPASSNPGTRHGCTTFQFITLAFIYFILDYLVEVVAKKM